MSVALTLPLPESVPPERVSVPEMSLAPLRVSVPPDMVRPSVATSRPTVMAEFTVMTGFAFGPRSINTVSPAVGTTPVLQLLPRLKLPLESVFQTFTPVNDVPR